MVPQLGRQFACYGAGDPDVQRGDCAKPLHGLSLHVEQTGNTYPVPARKSEKTPDKLLFITVHRMLTQRVEAFLQLRVCQRRTTLPCSLARQTKLPICAGEHHRPPAAQVYFVNGLRLTGRQLLQRPAQKARQPPYRGVILVHFVSPSLCFLWYERPERDRTKNRAPAFHESKRSVMFDVV